MAADFWVNVMRQLSAVRDQHDLLVGDAVVATRVKAAWARTIAMDGQLAVIRGCDTIVATGIIAARARSIATDSVPAIGIGYAIVTA